MSIAGSTVGVKALAKLRENYHSTKSNGLGRSLVAFLDRAVFQKTILISTVPLAVALLAISTRSIQEDHRKELARHSPNRQDGAFHSLDELLGLPSNELANIDIALMNLHCASSLPGSEDINIPLILRTLDDWAARVKSETERYHHQFLENPADYENSEAYFRMLMLVTVLQLDLGVHYNMQRVDKPDFRDSKDLFIHGLVGGDKGGTCVSMPVLYVAIARRLGYPLNLVLAREHVFCRWDVQGERFNIEGSGRGMVTYTDDYYRTWPKAIREDWVQDGQFLKSLTPQETLSVFLASRGDCLNFHGMHQEALKWYRQAARLMPQSKSYQYLIQSAQAVMEFQAKGGEAPLRMPPNPFSLEGPAKESEP